MRIAVVLCATSPFFIFIPVSRYDSPKRNISLKSRNSSPETVNSRAMKLLGALLGLSLAQNEEERALFGAEETDFDEQNRFLQEQRFVEQIKGLISGDLSCIAEVRENSEQEQALED